MYISCSCFMSKKPNNYTPSTSASCNIPDDYALLPVLLQSKRFEYMLFVVPNGKLKSFFYWGKHRLFGLDRIILQNQNCFSVPG